MTQQLDIFADTRPIQLANDIGAALARHDAVEAKMAIGKLEAEDLTHESLGHFRALAAFLEQWLPPTTEEVAERDLALAALRQSWSSLGSRTQEFLAPFLRDLAEVAAPSSAPIFWLRLREYEKVREVASAIAVPDRSSAVWRCLTVAAYEVGGLDAAIDPLLHLFWRAPDEAVILLDELRDLLLDKSWRSFLADLPDEDPRWFPVWLRFTMPALGAQVEVLPGNDSAALAWSIAAQIIDLERRGGLANESAKDLMAARERLKDVNASVYWWYMGRRQSFKS